MININPRRKLTAVIKDGKLFIEVDLLEEPVLSKSGKSRLVINTGGSVVSDAKIDGLNVIVNVNAYIR